MHVHHAQPDPRLSGVLGEKLVAWKRGGELAALDLGGYETRNLSVLKLIALADRDAPLPDFAPVLVHTGDRPINPGDASWRSVAFSTATGFSDIPGPDFLFDGWPQVGLGDYEEAAARAAHAGAQPAQDPRLGWIGNCDTTPIRWQLHALGEEHPQYLDVQHVAWIAHAPGEAMTTAAGNQMTLAEQVRRWGLLIDVEGNGWSARLKLLLHSGRPVFVQERPWQEWYFGALEPMVHVIPVRRDLSDLVEKVEWAYAHPQAAQAIGRAGQAFARRHLTRAAALARWQAVLAEVGADAARPAYAPPVVRQLLDPVLGSLGAL